MKEPVGAERRLFIGRLAVVVLALLATALAMQPDSTVLGVVSYAWAGLGASIGPTILLSLYWSRMSLAGALSGILVGGFTIILWSMLSGGIFDLYALVPGFMFSLAAIFCVSIVTKDAILPLVIEQFKTMEKQAGSVNPLG
jgi:sodium/proline symporter